MFRRAGTALLVVVLLVSACTDSDDASEGAMADSARLTAEELLAGLARSSGPGRESLVAALLAGARAEGSVTQYATNNAPPAEVWVPAFEAAFPGVRLDYVQMRAADVADRVLQEAGAGASIADVVLTTAPFLGGLEAAGLLASGVPVLVPPDRDPALRGETAAAVWVTPYAIGWNTDLVDLPDGPGGWDDLAAPDFPAGCILSDGSLTLYGWMIERLGEDGVRAWFDGVRANGGSLRPGMTSGDRVAAVAAGEFACVGDVTAPYLERLRRDGAPIAWSSPAGAPATVSSVAILRDTDRPHAAALLLLWALGPEAARLAADRGLMPTDPSAPAPSELAELFGTGRPLTDVVTVTGIARAAELERRSSTLLAEVLAARP